MRYGEKVYSLLIKKGTADFVVCLELLETMRKLEYLKSGGMIIVNREKIDPAPVAAGLEKYPPDIEDWLKANVKKHLVLDTKEALKEAGSAKALNIVMLGALSNFLEFTDEQWASAIRSLVKEKFVEMNLKAFALGKGLVAR